MGARFLVPIALASAGLLVSCGGGDRGNGTDGGDDAAADGGDAAIDGSPMDAAGDAAPDAAPGDAGTDAGPGRVCDEEETCDNGLDDDCDGMVEEGCACTPGAVAPCFGGDPAKRGVGECGDGTMTCESEFEFGMWGPCEGDVLPEAEACDADGLDEDCDGASNEGCECTPGSDPISCGTDVGQCESGLQECLDDGTLGSCEGNVGPVPETCDGLDEDCDGVVDEDLTRGCGSDVGACVAGTEACTDGAWGECSGGVGPSSETCNGTDDDCDGTTDEGVTRACGTDTGACSTGTETCTDGAWGACEGEVEPATETCNDTDDDCDGTIDEDAGCVCTDGETRSCGTDTGVCTTGTQSCEGDAWGGCTGDGPTEDPETSCDGLDNDCDGSVDESLSRECGSDVGECTMGTQSCSDGTWGTCSGSVSPTSESCDNLDNDCDASVDEELTRSCGTGVGECSEGTQTCSGGLWGECTDDEPSPETCNVLDDDCDGTTDEGLLENLGGDIRITDDPASDDFVAVGWSGSRFGLTWTRDGDLMFEALDELGSSVTSEVTLASGSTDEASNITWNDADGEFGVVWARNFDEVVLGRVQADGTVVGSESVIATGADTRAWPWIDFNGTHYGITWHGDVSFDDQIHFALVQPDGTVVRTLQVTTDPNDSRYSNVVWNGSSWGVVWADRRDGGGDEVYYARVSADGTSKEVDDVRISDTSGREARWPNVDVGPSGELGVAWHGVEGSSSDVWFARIELDGTLLGTTKVTAASRDQEYASVDWTGTQYIVAWQDERDSQAEVYYALMTADGIKNGGDVRVTNAPEDSMFVTAIWTGNHYGMGWRDERDGNQEIYFTYVGCP